MDELYFPQLDINWNNCGNWWFLSEHLSIRDGVQRELNKEIGPNHSLWGLQPIVIAKSNRSNDVLVVLNDARFAIVHLIWHGRIDNQPEKFPSAYIIGNQEALKKYVERL